MNGVEDTRLQVLFSAGNFHDYDDDAGEALLSSMLRPSGSSMWLHNVTYLTARNDPATRTGHIKDFRINSRPHLAGDPRVAA